MTNTGKNILLAGIIAVFWFTGCKDSWTKHFENVEAARKEGLIDKGWIPRSIPSDATNIEISGDQDSGIALGSFNSTDFDSVKKTCSYASDSFLIPDYAWRWLPVKRGPVDNVAALKSQGYEVFECDKQNFGLAYAQSKHQFYYWTPRNK